MSGRGDGGTDQWEAEAGAGPGGGGQSGAESVRHGTARIRGREERSGARRAAEPRGGGAGRQRAAVGAQAAPMHHVCGQRRRADGRGIAAPPPQNDGTAEPHTVLYCPIEPYNAP